MDATDNEWEKPLDEGYWEVLLREGKYSRVTSPPVNEGEILRELGAELLQPEDQVLNRPPSDVKGDPGATGDSGRPIGARLAVDSREPG